MNIIKSSILASVFLIPAFTIGAIIPLSSVQADEMFISGDAKSSVLSGEIIDIGIETLELSYNGDIIKVDIEDLDLDGAQHDLLKVGDVVRLSGQFDDCGFDADNLMVVNNTDELNVIVE